MAAELLGASKPTDILRGYLSKPGSATHIWQPRYCELKGNLFSYGVSPRLPMKGPYKVSGVGKGVEDPLMLEIFTDEGGFMPMKAKTEAEAMEWAVKLKAAKLLTAHEYGTDDLLASSTAVTNVGTEAPPPPSAVNHVANKLKLMEDQLGVTL